LGDDEETVIDRLALVVRIGGLCHDLGHLPMGHAVEIAVDAYQPLLNEVLGSEAKDLSSLKNLGKTALHEYYTYRILDTQRAALFATDTALADQVLDLFAGTSDHRFRRAPAPVVLALAELISSNIDSDRAEYLRRDGYVSGSGYGQYDIQRLIQSYQIAVNDKGEFKLRPVTRALTAIHSFLMERVKAYGSLYYHNLGVLFDVLLARVLHLLWVPADHALAVTGLSGASKSNLGTVVGRLGPRDFLYSSFAGPRGYVDDARLWVYLNDILAAIQVIPSAQYSLEMRRLKTYLSVLLRRNHHWVTLWKDRQALKQSSEPVLQVFVDAMNEKLGEEHAPEEYLEEMRLQMSEKAQFEYPTPSVSAINYIAYGYEAQLDSIARELEERLGDGHFVEIGQRTAFKPISDPNGYEVIGRDGQLVRLTDVAPAAVQSVQALWFENILLRVFVITEHVLDKTERDRVQTRALQVFPDAIRSWIRTSGEGIGFAFRARTDSNPPSSADEVQPTTA
jgi:hypothetical protein